MADNKFAGKLYEGTFAGGEGPIMGVHTVSESENKAIFGGETMDEGTRAKSSSTGSETKSMNPTGDDGLFDLHSSSYAGPENMQPEQKGISNPFDIH